MSVSTATKGRLDLRWVIHKDNREKRRARRISQPLIRIWDGDWNYRGRIANSITANFQWKYNETGVAMLELPVDHYISQWIIDVENRSTRNVHISMDKDGARWTGRMASATVTGNEDEGYKLVIEFNHDYEELKWILSWCNPFLPAAVQFPRIFLMAGPSAFVLKLALFCNLLRLNANLWSLPDNPLDLASWVSGLDMSTWSIIVKPHDLLHDSTLWSLYTSRFKTIHEASQDIVKDGQLMWVMRRWLHGDPQPWAGFTPRNGALIVDVVDKSGYYSETALGGTLFGGMARTVAQIGDDFLTETLDLINDPTDDSQHTVSNWMGVVPRQPWIVLRAGETRSPIRTSEFTIVPATAIQVVAGGKSAPGVNELIKAAVIGGFGAIGALFQFDALGSVVNAIAEPLYRDTILAWWAFKHLIRAQHAGWSHYHERLAEGGDQAYTLSSVMALRVALWATRSRMTHTLECDAMAIPYSVGDNGKGHFFLGDRIGSTVKGAPKGKVYVDQVTEMVLSLSREQAPGWQFVIGEREDKEEPIARLMRHVQNVFGALTDLGVA